MSIWDFRLLLRNSTILGVVLRDSDLYSSVPSFFFPLLFLFAFDWLVGKYRKILGVVCLFIYLLFLGEMGGSFLFS